jgi:hypothetical protein
MKRLTKNFKHSEFFVSGKYPDLASRAKYLRPKHIDDLLFLLCHLILQPVRNFIACPIFVTSGYRDKVLNNKTDGSSKNSLHMQGMAADFTTDNKHLLHFAFDFIKENLAGRFGELILYVDDFNKPISIHVVLPKQGKEPYIEKRIKKEAKRFTE